MRSPLKLQAEKPSLPQPLLMEEVLQHPGQAGVHPGVLPCARGWAETECAVLTVVNRGQVALFTPSGILLSAFSARAGCCLTIFAFCLAAP